MNEPDLVRRQAVRVILLDQMGRTLLFRGGPQPSGFWFTPGGGVEEGEDLEAAARREVLEEAGLVLGDLGPPLRSEEIEFFFEGQRIVQFQTYFRVCLEGTHEVSTAGWTEVEVRSVSDHRWWSREEISTSGERIYPEDLLDWMY